MTPEPWSVIVLLLASPILLFPFARVLGCYFIFSTVFMCFLLRLIRFSIYKIVLLSVDQN